MKSVILTGLRANTNLTIGNYFGALLPIVQMAKQNQDNYQINLFVPDLHSFTTAINHKILKTQIMDNIKMFVAAGLPLNDNNVFLYRQSYIPAHSELTWILDCFTSFGEMSRMTQFKDKSQNLISDNDMSLDQELTEIKGKNISVGLFNYPVLMASDILLYDAKYVPVGEDQTQHLEFARDIAERFNNKFEPVFTVPEPVDKQNQFFQRQKTLKIMDLADPTKKMSKSDESSKGVIFLNDSPEAVKKKIMSATTDSLEKISYNPASQQGISNLLQLLALLDNQSIDEVSTRFSGQTQYGPLKKELAEKTCQFVADFQAKLAQVDEQVILTKLQQDEETMNQQAQAKLLKVQQLVGIR